ncbi:MULTISPECIES: NAD(P)H-dependent glycerol-3-phosphate dehydrogenase [Anaerotruncus]|jgi:glycerol-3-phosphate dehydrogenase (NAD(P)+)|uniref:NAD(P)H-dependent glycerol-3-phosphate dehydrogenase n=1 Tax=Anaerotruncus TaxID=244127 RepID=UPI000834D79D|nr:MULTISPECIES: NAD(P)H-dependent glycerol-3-phosphate dehydrogenase [Anaerotruncus]RGX56040.1 NAD(P)-dependent glycerol-3-phosphate dehydrogenase [Anaerotruncus sp. AF02-27]
MAEIMILGAGGFGTSLAVMCEKNGHHVTLYSPFQKEIEVLSAEREHKKLLPGVHIPETIKMTWQLPEKVDHDLVIVATPSFAVRGVCASIKDRIVPKTVVACVAKGFELETLKTLDTVMGEELPQNGIVMLSGPSHAEEVGRGVPTTIVAASRSRAAAEFAQDTLMNPALRIYVNDDVTGVELGGALKNVIALAAGIVDGLELGDNPKAALMTRGITEIARLGVAMGAKTETFAGLSGIGDLIVTCTSMHSRNHRAGILIGKGRTAQQAIDEVGMTVEGYTATKCAHELADRTGVEMPIMQQVYAVLYEGKTPEDAIRDLMGRPKRHESEVIWLLSR